MEAHVQTLARGQAERGARVTVFCVNHHSGPTIVERDAKVLVIRFRRIAAAAKIDFCPSLLSRLASREMDLLHVHVPNPTMILAVLLARPQTPIVVTYQSDHIRQPFRGALFRPVEQRFYKKVSTILATSADYFSGSSFLQKYAKRVRLLPLGIDAQYFLEPGLQDRQESVRIRCQFQGPLWLACGRLVYYKGLVYAVRALSGVRGTLLIVGDGPERLRLEAEVRRLGLDRRVIFLGNVRSVVPYYHAAQALWFPSNARSEAFGLVQVEAMASGCPVINTAIPHSGVSWVSRHMETGLTVPVNDAAALADAANRLLVEPDLRDRLSAAARIRAVQEFDYRVMVKRSLNIYCNVLANEPIDDSVVLRKSA
jgi:rhamnosyl/mannosyltransferase